jgi:hypothetical protein
MAKTAINQLQEQIEAVRREAFAAGYAAAMQSIREFASKPAPGTDAATPPRRRQRGTQSANLADAARKPARRAKGRETAPQRSRRSAAGRPQRGTNARLVEEVLQANAPRALRPAEIRSAIQREKGVAIAFTSIRHALGQLEGRHAAEQVGDSKTWRYRESGDAAAQ